MKSNNVIFRKYEVIGETKDAAMKQTPLNLRVDATSAYKKFIEKNAVTDDSLKEFMKEYLKKKKFDMPNDGAYIVLQSPVLDKRQRPYEIDKVKYEVRTHTPKATYVLRDEAGNVVGTEKTSKDAINAAKEYTTDYHETVTINYEWVSKESNTLYATCKYTPSAGTRDCKLLVFGYEVVD